MRSLIVFLFSLFLFSSTLCALAPGSLYEENPEPEPPGGGKLKNALLRVLYVSNTMTSQDAEAVIRQLDVWLNDIKSRGGSPGLILPIYVPLFPDVSHSPELTRRFPQIKTKLQLAKLAAKDQTAFIILEAFFEQNNKIIMEFFSNIIITNNISVEAAQQLKEQTPFLYALLNWLVSNNLFYIEIEESNFGAVLQRTLVVEYYKAARDAYVAGKYDKYIENLQNSIEHLAELEKIRGRHLAESLDRAVSRGISMAVLSDDPLLIATTLPSTQVQNPQKDVKILLNSKALAPHIELAMRKRHNIPLTKNKNDFLMASTYLVDSLSAVLIDKHPQWTTSKAFFIARKIASHFTVAELRELSKRFSRSEDKAMDYLDAQLDKKITLEERALLETSDADIPEPLPLGTIDTAA